MDVTGKNQSAMALMPLKTLFGNVSVIVCASKLLVNSHIKSLYVVVSLQGKHRANFYCYLFSVLTVLKLAYLESKRFILGQRGCALRLVETFWLMQTFISGSFN